MGPIAIPLSQYVTRSNCNSKQSSASKNMDLMSPGPALRFRIPKPQWGQGGFTLQHSGRPVKADLEGLINTSAISNPKSKCHYAMWFGKLQASIFRQVGFLLEPFTWHWPKPESESRGTIMVESFLKLSRFFKEPPLNYLSGNSGLFGSQQFSSHEKLYCNTSPFMGMLEAEQAQRDVTAASFTTVMLAIQGTILAFLPWNKFGSAYLDRNQVRWVGTDKK